MMTLGELREALARIDAKYDDSEICVRCQRQEDDESFIGGLHCAEIQFAHDDDETPFLALDASDEGE